MFNVHKASKILLENIVIDIYTGTFTFTGTIYFLIFGQDCIGVFALFTKALLIKPC